MCRFRLWHVGGACQGILPVMLYTCLKHMPSWRRSKVLFAIVCLAAAIAVSAAMPAVAHADGDRIHILMFKYSADCIVLESDGRFGVVDCAEDSYYPDGSDERYPWRDYISTEERSNTDQVIGYLDSIGANTENVEFLVGTHPHSDHIANAPQVIERYLPDRVYTPEYSDDYITEPSQLWDNLFVYDRLVEAAEANGSALIRHFYPDAPVTPEEGSDVGCSEFDLGSMHITLLNTDESYKETGVYGANAFSLGVLVEANGQRAFLAGDINNIPESSGGKSTEDNIAPLIGDVDVLKLGHHGNMNSNTANFLYTLSPEIAVQTGKSYQLVAESKDVLLELGSAYYCTDLALEQGVTEIIVELDAGGSYVSNVESMPMIKVHEEDGLAHAYLYGEPYAYTGWLSDATRYWYFDNSSVAAADAWVKIDGKWYRYDESSNPITGWFDEGEARYYLDAKGVMATGWKQIDGSWYYFGSNGVMQSGGWKKIDGSWYYLTSSGAAMTGWMKQGKVWYWFAPNAVMATGWKNIDGSWYLFDSSGGMKTGWQKVGGAWYYLDSKGAMITGWLKIDDVQYYFRDSGAAAVGWVRFGDDWYHFGSSGAMQTGWLKSGGTYCYLKSSGVMATGWQKVGGAWYWFKDSGTMQTGWLKLNGTWYYFKSSGAMVTGSQVIGGKQYRFSSSGAML